MALKCKNCGSNRAVCLVTEQLTGPAVNGELIYDEVTKCETLETEVFPECFDCGGPMEDV